MDVTFLPPNRHAAGVDLFCVIRGFFMWGTTWDSPTTPGRFMLQHIHRIVPLHWAITSFYVLVLLAAPHLMQSGAFEPAYGTTCSLPSLAASDDRCEPAAGHPGLDVELRDVLLPRLRARLFLPKRRARLATVALLDGLVAAGPAFASQSAPLQVYTSTMLSELLFGMGVAVLAARRRQPRRWPGSRSARSPGSGAGRSFRRPWPRRPASPSSVSGWP